MASEQANEQPTTQPTRPPARPQPPTGRNYAWYVLAVMVGINFLNYMDRYLGASVAPSIQRELHISDSAVGFLGTAFLLVYALAAVPFGLWGDRGARNTVIGVGVAIWSVATLLTGFARNYAQLFLTRGVVGVGEASYYPAGTSLMSDYFPKDQRSRVMAIWGAGATVGIAVGYAGGGIIAEKLGWRAAFFFAAAPGLIFAALAFTMREPLRGAVEQTGKAVAKTAEASLQKFLDLLKIPTLRATIIAQTLLFFVLASNAFWLPTYLQRRFAMTPGTAGLLAGGVIVAGGLIGILAGGWIADRRALKDPRAHLQVGIVGFVAGAILIVVAILSPQLPVFVPFFFLTVICLY
ncbi:MAG TPA: MFS transporter, partial [Candidatus Dormibacteraeota bacterium]|nr:MFS transporter [Candidatus Dormibacteraeota bacterium]